MHPLVKDFYSSIPLVEYEEEEDEEDEEGAIDKKNENKEELNFEEYAYDDKNIKLIHVDFAL